jgi:hypothetical protein
LRIRSGGVRSMPTSRDEIVNADNVTVATVERSAGPNFAWNEVSLPVPHWVKRPSDDPKSCSGTACVIQLRPLTRTISIKSATSYPFLKSLQTSSRLTWPRRGYAQPGASFRLRVKTAHPQTMSRSGNKYRRPDQISKALTPLMKQTTRTDANGFATVDSRFHRTSKETKAKLRSPPNVGCCLETVKGKLISIVRRRSWSDMTSRSINRTDFACARTDV